MIVDDQPSLGKLSQNYGKDTLFVRVWVFQVKSPENKSQFSVQDRDL